MRTNKEIRTRRDGLRLLVVPAGVRVERAWNLPGERYWIAAPWSGASEYALGQIDVGIAIDAEDVS